MPDPRLRVVSEHQTDDLTDIVEPNVAAALALIAFAIAVAFGTGVVIGYYLL